MSKLLTRAGGVCAVIAAVLIVVQQWWTVFVTGPVENLPDSVMYSLQLLLMVFGVMGIALAQQHLAGAFAQSAALVAIFGCVVWFASSLVEVTMLPSLAAAGSPLADHPPTTMGVVAVVGLAGYLLGLVLLSVAIVVTRVLPRWAAVLLGGGIVLGLALQALVPGILVVYAIGLGWLGMAAVRTAGKDWTGPEPASGPTPEAAEKQMAQRSA